MSEFLSTLAFKPYRSPIDMASRDRTLVTLYDCKSADEFCYAQDLPVEQPKIWRDPAKWTELNYHNKSNKFNAENVAQYEVEVTKFNQQFESLVEAICDYANQFLKPDPNASVEIKEDFQDAVNTWQGHFKQRIVARTDATTVYEVEQKANVLGPHDYLLVKQGLESIYFFLQSGQVPKKVAAEQFATMADAFIKCATGLSNSIDDACHIFENATTKAVGIDHELYRQRHGLMSQLMVEIASRPDNVSRNGQSTHLKSKIFQYARSQGWEPGPDCSTTEVFEGAFRLSDGDLLACKDFFAQHFNSGTIAEWMAGSIHEVLSEAIQKAAHHHNGEQAWAQIENKDLNAFSGPLLPALVHSQDAFLQSYFDESVETKPINGSGLAVLYPGDITCFFPLKTKESLRSVIWDKLRADRYWYYDSELQNWKQDPLALPGQPVLFENLSWDLTPERPCLKKQDAQQDEKQERTFALQTYHDRRLPVWQGGPLLPEDGVLSPARVAERYPLLGIRMPISHHQALLWDIPYFLVNQVCLEVYQAGDETHRNFSGHAFSDIDLRRSDLNRLILDNTEFFGKITISLTQIDHFQSLFDQKKIRVQNQADPHAKPKLTIQQALWQDDPIYMDILPELARKKIFNLFDVSLQVEFSLSDYLQVENSLLAVQSRLSEKEVGDSLVISEFKRDPRITAEQRQKNIKAALEKLVKSLLASGEGYEACIKKIVIFLTTCVFDISSIFGLTEREVNLIFDSFCEAVVRENRQDLLIDGFKSVLSQELDQEVSRINWDRILQCSTFIGKHPNIPFSIPTEIWIRVIFPWSKSASRDLPDLASRFNSMSKTRKSLDRFFFESLLSSKAIPDLSKLRFYGNNTLLHLAIGSQSIYLDDLFNLKELIKQENFPMSLEYLKIKNDKGETALDLFSFAPGSGQAGVRVNAALSTLRAIKIKLIEKEEKDSDQNLFYLLEEKNCGQILKLLFPEVFRYENYEDVQAARKKIQDFLWLDYGISEPEEYLFSHLSTEQKISFFDEASKQISARSPLFEMFLKRENIKKEIHQRLIPDYCMAVDEKTSQEAFHSNGLLERITKAGILDPLKIRFSEDETLLHFLVRRLNLLPCNYLPFDLLGKFAAEPQFLMYKNGSGKTALALFPLEHRPLGTHAYLFLSLLNSTPSDRLFDLCCSLYELLGEENYLLLVYRLGKFNQRVYSEQYERENSAFIEHIRSSRYLLGGRTVPEYLFFNLPDDKKSDFLGKLMKKTLEWNDGSTPDPVVNFLENMHVLVPRLQDVARLIEKLDTPEDILKVFDRLERHRCYRCFNWIRSEFYTKRSWGTWWSGYSGLGGQPVSHDYAELLALGKNRIASILKQKPAPWLEPRKPVYSAVTWLKILQVPLIPICGFYNSVVRHSWYSGFNLFRSVLILPIVVVSLGFWSPSWFSMFDVLCEVIVMPLFIVAFAVFLFGTVALSPAIWLMGQCVGAVHYLIESMMCHFKPEQTLKSEHQAIQDFLDQPRTVWGDRKKTLFRSHCRTLREIQNFKSDVQGSGTEEEEKIEAVSSPTQARTPLLSLYQSRNLTNSERRLANMEPNENNEREIRTTIEPRF